MLASNVCVAKTRYGSVSYYADDQYIGKSLAAYGEYSELEAALWRKLIKRGDIAIDIGANIGTLTLALADMVGEEGRIIAIEPQPETANLLQRNVSDNSLDDRVRVWPCALGAANGTTRVPSLAALGHKNYGGVAIGVGELDVDIYALDSRASLDGADRATFIKIDVEGHEIAVLNGARRLIETCRPLLYIENHPDLAGQDLLRTVRALGYRAWDHRPPLFSPANWNGRQDDVFERIASFNMLCIPTEKVDQYRNVTDELMPLIPARPSCGKSEWVGIARLGGIGDNLITASVMRPLKKAGLKVDVITQMPQAVVFENNPFIDKLSIQRDLPSNHVDWQKWFSLRAHEYERFVNLSHTCEVSLGFLQSQCHYQWPPETRRRLADHNYLEFVCDIVGVPYDFGPLFFPTTEEMDQALTTRRKYCGDAPLIGWCVTGTRADKIYPQSAHAVGRFIKETGAHVALLGAPPPASDLNFANQIVEDVKRTNSTLDGLHTAISPSLDNETWPIRRLLTFASVCDLVVGPDTGPMWAVAFEAMPKIVLLSHASPKNITQHWINTTTLHADQRQVPCWPCHLLIDTPADCIEERRRCGMKILPDADKLGAACITSIAVETIVSIAKTKLKGKADGIS